MLIDIVDVCTTISTTNITIFKIPTHHLKGNWIITLGESMYFYKTISTTHIILILTTILLRESVVVYRTTPTNHVTNLKIIINCQWRKGVIISNTCRQFLIRFLFSYWFYFNTNTIGWTWWCIIWWWAKGRALGCACKCYFSLLRRPSTEDNLSAWHFQHFLIFCLLIRRT